MIYIYILYCTNQVNINLISLVILLWHFHSYSVLFFLPFIPFLCDLPSCMFAFPSNIESALTSYRFCFSLFSHPLFLPASQTVFITLKSFSGGILGLFGDYIYQNLSNWIHCSSVCKGFRIMISFDGLCTSKLLLYLV